MDLVFEPARTLAGTVMVPGDKSVTHRAYLLAAVAEGTTRILGANDGADCRATRDALAALGVAWQEAAGETTIVGRPHGLIAPAAPLDLGNSGTGLRLLTGLLVGQGVPATLGGDASLSTRPMERVVAPLRAMGADVTATGTGQRPPVVVRPAGPLRALRHRLPIASAQVKSCILLAGLGATGVTTVEEPLASRDHTERMLPAFGVPVARQGERECALEGPATLRSPGRLVVPGDLSAALFWLVAASIVGEGEIVLPGVGLNPGRVGALAVLKRMGARIEIREERIEGGEPVGNLVARPASLVAADVAPEEIPLLIDELPVLAIAQAFARGVSRVRGAGELRVKESDRISTVVKGLQALGGKALEVEDGWDVEGGMLAEGTIESHGDHRVAMAFGVAALAARGPVRVRDGEMIDTSYPRFYSALRDRVTSR